MAQIDDALLIKIYHARSLAVDMLPYTTEMRDILTGYNRVHRKRPSTLIDLYRRLILLRKSGRLIAKDKTSAAPAPKDGFLFNT